MIWPFKKRCKSDDDAGEEIRRAASEVSETNERLNGAVDVLDEALAELAKARKAQDG